MFKAADYVVYPAHGVGHIEKIETQKFDGFEVTLLVIMFDKDRMVLRLPIQKAVEAGLRPLSSKEQMEEALESLKIKPKSRRVMWSRRAQEYEAKINSGDPVSIAQVIRDLFRSSAQPDQSYSERQIYQSAVDRFVRELAVVEKINEHDAARKLEEVLKAA